MDTFFIVFLIVLCVIVLASLLVSYVFYRKIFYADQKGKIKEMTPLKGKLYEKFFDQSNALIQESDKISFEPIEMKISKTFSLRGRYYFVKEGAPLAIMVHGYKGCGIRDFSGGLKEMISRGCNVLLINHRGHANSDGRTIGFGVKERKDVIKWIEFVNQKFNYPDIYLYGISMGAATVLMVSGSNIPSNVKAVIADCPYASVKEELRYKFDVMGIPFGPCYPFIWLGALLYGHFNIMDGEVANYIKNTKIPIMIVHGTIDDIVPIKLSRDLVSKFPEKIKLIEIENAPHGMSYFVDYKRYGDELTSFINSVK